MVAHLLQNLLGVAGGQKKMRHGSAIRPTMHLASMDIKTAFDVARTKHIARTMEDHDVHGWIVAGLFREIAGLEGWATFDCMESKFSFARCTRQGSVDAPRLWLTMTMQILGNVEPEWAKKESQMQLYVGRQLLDHVSLKGALGIDDEGSD